MSKSFAFLTLALLLSCNQKDLPSESCDVIPILANESSYQARTEPETAFVGVLAERNCNAPPPPNRRPHCFWLGALPVYEGAQENRTRLRVFVGSDVMIFGKKIPIDPALGGGSEIWPSVITCD